MRLTSFYANSLQYKLLNVHISKKQKSSREDERAMEILRKKTEEVSYPLGETDQHEDQSWKTFWILFTARGGGTPIHYLYGYVPPKGVVILKLLV